MIQVSIIVLTYNSDWKKLCKTIKSAASQKKIDFEIVVCDDGTCQANGYCEVTEDGYAKASDKGWRVLKRMDENHVMVLFYLK